MFVAFYYIYMTLDTQAFYSVLQIFIYFTFIYSAEEDMQQFNSSTLISNNFTDFIMRNNTLFNKGNGMEDAF